ncbi:hypothetical protein SESBI_43658 [Sesbania bispinosa]|nr:hypothetical protein SESBI_43658 [Sesbania bispinosa]
MGKKVNQSSVKISKDEKQQFNSLMKVLRPKVYITDSSSFKKLVQELTGNGNSTTLSPPPLEPNMVQNCPLIGTEFQRDPETSVDVSVSTEATSNSSELCYATLMNEEFNQVCDQLCLDDSIFQDSVTNQPLDQFFSYQNLESLLYDVDPNSFYNCYEHIEQPEVSIYDYELSGLL